MQLPARATVIEVGLRDGLQAEPQFVQTSDKIAMADALAAAGVSAMEVTSFVHPAAVPQMADAEAVVAGVTRHPSVSYGALVLNQKGAERAAAAGVDEIRYATMVSETFSQRNARMPVGESLRQMEAAAALCLATPDGPRFTGVLGTCFGCPYEGDIPINQSLAVIGAFMAAGAREVTLCDTTGMANPHQVLRTCTEIRERWPALVINLHFHNTRGMGLANVLAGLEAGITRFESSIGGLGGCPFAPRATGNVATEDLVHMLHTMGVETGLNLTALIAVAQTAERILGRELPGQVMKAGPAREVCS